MFYRVVVPIAVVAILSLIVLALVYWRHLRNEDLEREKEAEARRDWDHECEFDHPDTGAKCQRTDFHLTNHYHEINGRVMEWWS